MVDSILKPVQVKAPKMDPTGNILEKEILAAVVENDLTTKALEANPPKEATRRGILIALEGADRRETWISFSLASSLREAGFNVSSRNFPDPFSATRQAICHFEQPDQEPISTRVAQLLLSADKWETIDESLKLLHQGASVIVNRYAYSCAAHYGIAGRPSLEWCKTTNMGLPKPDIVCHLHHRVERPFFRGICLPFDGGYESQDYQDSIKANYEELKKEKDVAWVDVEIEGRTDEEIINQLTTACLEVLKSPNIGPLGQLWMAN